MHTCPPPTDALAGWLDPNPTVKGNFGHLLLVQQSEIDGDLIDALRPYFESAHLDAREYFHEQIGISLHPDAAAGAAGGQLSDLPAFKNPSWPFRGSDRWSGH